MQILFSDTHNSGLHDTGRPPPQYSLFGHFLVNLQGDQFLDTQFSAQIWLISRVWEMRQSATSMEFVLKSMDFVLKMMNFVLKITVFDFELTAGDMNKRELVYTNNEELCIKIVELCIRNDGLCKINDLFCQVTWTSSTRCSFKVRFRLIFDCFAIDFRLFWHV